MNIPAFSLPTNRFQTPRVAPQRTFPQDTFTLRFGNTPTEDQPVNQPAGPGKGATVSNTTTANTQRLHMINDIPYKTADGQYQMVVEIPAGTTEKWQTDPVTGEFYHDKINGTPRIVNFLPYPMNYGIVPQTILSRAKGGDGDPTDIITLAPGQPRGTYGPVRVIGAIKFAERGEIDTKVVAVLPDGPFKDINDISEMLMKYPGAVEIIKMWFEGYKGPGSFLFQGYASRQEAVNFIEETYQDWVAEVKNKP